MRKKNKLMSIVLLLGMALFAFSCSTKNDLDAFKEAKYSLSGINEIKLNGVNVLNKKRPEDFSFSEAAMLFSAFSDNNLLAYSNLGLNVELDEGSKERSMTVTKLKWQLLLDGKQTLSGLVDEPVELRHGLNTINVRTPIMLSEENGKPGYNNLIRLVTLLSKSDGPSRPEIVLQIKPTIQTSVGPVEMPGFINVKN
ncbi:hypothetical protein H9Q13_00235 [Pontibacter sp. JH31]|uniref:Late embryogenesis abundant protein n=1 Tax=Pontibacter aquaedesilientis TaxID=2766980 RepID=A0ABR7XB96_9BACT|nr:hypothetical protein [Pontibacter aquaedesilientis]MBD1395579.1 hypothetical protein [Pontibacter aquaedesilientis]